jgi:hypothetical protein
MSRIAQQAAHHQSPGHEEGHMLASFVVGGLVALSLIVGGVAQAQSSCDAGITKAAGKKVACKLNVVARAQKTGATVDTVKLAKCETKFTSSCTKAQGQGDCTVQTPPCDAIEATADACVDSLSAGPPTTTTTTTATTTTTTSSHPTAPPCADLGESCGSCGNGICFGLCPEGQGGVCTSNYSSIGCINDAECPADEDCVSVRLGTDYCGGACVKPC